METTLFVIFAVATTAQIAALLALCYKLAQMVWTKPEGLASLKKAAHKPPRRLVAEINNPQTLPD